MPTPKITRTQYARLPHPLEAALLPWDEVTLDLVDPWTVTAGQDTYDFYALTCIDPVTNFPDARRL
jgi:hypothetical protein